MAKRKFTIVLIKPSHYDDDGYVIQRGRSDDPPIAWASVWRPAGNAPRPRSWP